MRQLRLLLFLTVSMVPVSVMGAANGGDTSLFHQGRSHVSINGGYGRANNQNYGVVGLGAGYYLLEGLDATLNAEAWIGAKPHVYKVSPGLTYVLDTPQFKPYLGGFYRHTFYDTLADLDSAGGRAGLVLPLSPRTYATAGLVYEQQFHCDKAVYDTCSQVYPEASFAYSF